MDEDVIRVVATAAAGLIMRAMGTAAWHATRDRWARLLGRNDPERSAAITEQLQESAVAVAAAEPTGNTGPVTAEVEAEWRGTVRAMLREHPDLVEAVRSAIADAPTEAADSVHQNASVHGGISVQSGRDTTIR